MSRKHLLVANPEDIEQKLAEEGRQIKKPGLPLLGVKRNDHPNRRLSNTVVAAFQESTERNLRAEEIERRLAEGQAVIELAAAEIDPSFVQDRMEGDIDGLRTSIREQGQQVPILVRPHPDQPGRYQIAFGHRRLRALKDLDLPVKAIVRDLSDEQLVVAQGQENNERQDLSFIEKARFANRLKDRFSRDIITTSLSIDKPALSKMLSIIAALPIELVDAIGPAPTVGRRNWQELVDSIEKTRSTENIVEFAKSIEVQGLPSDERFKAALAHLKPPVVVRGVPGILSTPAGTRLGQVRNSKTKLELTIDKKVAPDFATFILEKLPALYEEHSARDQRKNGE
ncbi:plasmid partitioning protein RepB [Rhizobium sp. VS19-DR104.2]|uniref:plasmid partitioning protein RepB n=1 Tax=unclassified Rhizobium TaxID=2613769 RepID=UPI001CC69669|nr:MULTISPECIES: plasmid partitioning protein RepB [unclassified Rhizobium]MBZ5762257.1 plasmid partitioning protein RepB [Rhizobium sp. VS19-DR96]MBZ5768273.1 plasmid partitioning protein RepB [Rhizobium sp. VS19-DR129.2]MBZ5775855.1 plasmid partitioning protein RepB [Rhizobium sp. VS19-DRK62.2]MBZ5787124.1 plasmid partitioning protein RepB [Rhizobium sp. VS19-DR121]MBZ5804198.1 plasmid partitioning protein RepB [Rhizobium sp. VS19-DR181]